VAVSRIERAAVLVTEQAVNPVEVVRVARIDLGRGVRALDGEHALSGVALAPAGRLRPVEEVEDVHAQGEGVRLRQLHVEGDGSIQRVEARAATERTTGEDEDLVETVDRVTAVRREGRTALVL